MNELTKQNAKKADQLLKRLCESGSLNMEKTYSVFEDDNVTDYVCSIFQENRLANITKISAQSGEKSIYYMCSTENTSGFLKNGGFKYVYEKSHKKDWIKITTLIIFFISVAFAIWIGIKNVK